MAEPLLLMGVPGSPYTRKMLAVLRYRRIPYALLMRDSPLQAELPKPKVELLPTFYLPDAAGEIEAVTDSTPLIRRFEAEFPARQVRPTDPVVRFIDSLLEDYADEWLTKAMFHFRWHFAADIAKSADIIPRWRNITASNADAAESNAKFSRRQIDRLRFVGSNPATADVIEASYVRFLDAFEALLKLHPYLMGARPGAADFGVYGQLTQLAHFDPTPAAITLACAPRVYAWVGLVDDLSGLDPTDEQWISRGAIASVLGGLLAEVGRVYVPVMLANARALMTGAQRLETQIDGKPWVQNSFPYQAKCLKWLREEFSALSSADQAAARQILESAGCGALVGESL